MNIVCIVRPAPGWEKPRFNLETGEAEVSAGAAVGLSAWGEGTWVLNPTDRAALDAAMDLAAAAADIETGRNLITVLALAGADATAAREALYEALAHGANRAILLDADIPADPGAEATALAAAVRDLDRSAAQHLVLCGTLAPDGSPDALAPMLAAALEWPQLTDAPRLRLPLAGPLVASVGPAGWGTPRYTYGAGIMGAYRHTDRFEHWDRARLGELAPDRLTPRVTTRRNALADAPTGERLTGPIEESVAVVLQGLKGQGLR